MYHMYICRLTTGPRIPDVVLELNHIRQYLNEHDDECTDGAAEGERCLDEWLHACSLNPLLPDATVGVQNQTGQEDALYCLTVVFLINVY